MIAKLIVEGKEFDIEILDPKLQKLIVPNKTGYERVNMGETFYSVRADGTVFEPMENHSDAHNLYYEIANYHSSKDLAYDNARADKLMRQLRRFAAEHRVNSLNWDSNTQAKWMIYHSSDGLGVYECNNIHSYGTIYFDRLLDADAAIETFRDELIWYFTEYKDSL